MRIRCLSVLVVVLFLAGCSGDSSPTDPGTTPPETPGLGMVTVEAAASVGLAARLDYEPVALDAVRAVVRREQQDPVERVTAEYPPTGMLHVLGLAPDTRYAITLEGIAGEDTVRETVSYRAEVLPDPLNRLIVSVAGDPVPGYTFTGTAIEDIGYALAFDGSGTIRWYKQLDGYTGGHVEPMPNGNWIAFIGASRGFDVLYGYYQEFTPAGEPVRRYQAPAPLYTDGHELLFTDWEGGGEPVVHLLSYDFRRGDLTEVGGGSDVLLAGHQLLRMRGPVVEFSWNAWDHFEIADWIEGPEQLFGFDPVDFDHPNSITIDHDGHYIVSFRHFAQAVKIHSRTGEVIWRMGGRANEFDFSNDSGFSAQHHIQVLEDGNLLVFDNGISHDPPESRMVEYRVDEEGLEAVKVREFRRSPQTFSMFQGSVQRIRDNGHSLVGYSLPGIITEAEPRTGAVWEALLRDGAVGPAVFYRAHRIESLDTFATP